MLKNRKGISPITETGLLFMIVRGIIVLFFYLILIRPYVDQIGNETLKFLFNIIIFIIALAFTIGGGKGLMKLGDIFTFRR